MSVKDFPVGSDSKASACNAGDPGSIPGSGRSPGEGNGNPLQYSCLEKSMDYKGDSLIRCGVWETASANTRESSSVTVQCQSQWLPPAHFVTQSVSFVFNSMVPELTQWVPLALAKITDLWAASWTWRMLELFTSSDSFLFVVNSTGPTAASPQGTSSVHGILQARTLEWVAMPFSRGSFPPRDRTLISYISWIGRRVLYR